MSFPKVTLLYSNGNLLQDIAAADGIAGLVAPAATTANNNKIYTVYNLADAVAQGITSDAEQFAYRHIKEFYAQVGGNQELWIMLTTGTVLMANMLDITNVNGAIKLIKAAGGKIRLLGITYKNYTVAGTDFLEADVQAAFTASKTFAQGCLALLMPVRILIEGIIGTETSSTIFNPSTGTNGFAGIVLGNTTNTPVSKGAAVGAVLGRAVSYPAHIKIGKVANGPLNVTEIKIGSKSLADMANLEALHDLGYISFLNHPQKAGYFIGIDHMGSVDDYRLLAYGRVVDKAAVIAAAVYINELEGEVDVDVDGKILETDCKHLEGRIEQQINTAMADQISGLEVLIDPNQNIITTNKLKVKIRVRPKGYTTFIDVDLGLTATGI